jgi:hypothetical protein
VTFRETNHALKLTRRSGDALLIAAWIFTELTHLDVASHELFSSLLGDNWVDVISGKVDVCREFGELLI